MSNPFSVTTPTCDILLRASRRAEASFTVSNVSGRPMRGRALVATQSPAAAPWLVVEGETERDFPAATTEQYVVQIAVPPDAPAGEYVFRLDVVGVQDPDELYSQGPSVTFQVPAPEVIPSPKRFPWWIVAAIGAAIVLIVLAAVFWPRKVTVPSLRGLEVSEANKRLSEMRLQVARVDEVQDAELTHGRVVRSEPAEGARVKRGSGVVLLVSKGQPPVADLVVDKRQGDAPLQVSCVDRSQGSPTSWHWDWGDGASDDGQAPPKHTYTQAGTYTIKLTATNAAGSDTAVKEAWIVVLEPGCPPVADFRVDRPKGTAPHEAAFADLSTCEPTSWRWDFGDNSSSSDENPKHTYTKSGSYTVTLTVGNAKGSDTKSVAQMVVVTMPWQVVGKIGPYGGPFGGWTAEQRCPEGQWAYAVSLRVEGDQGGLGDDTALNGIRLTCGTNASGRQEISSGGAPWGGWSAPQACGESEGFITSARLRIEPSLGAGDDTGAVDAEFQCASRSGAILRGTVHHNWGEWKAWQSCPAGTAICGIRTKVEAPITGDDTALNDAEFQCCTLP